LEEEVIAACLIDWNWVPPRDYIPVGTSYNTLYSEIRIAQPTFFCYAGMDVNIIKLRNLSKCESKRDREIVEEQ
jgi:hypothetical protein